MEKVLKIRNCEEKKASSKKIGEIILEGDCLVETAADYQLNTTGIFMEGESYVILYKETPLGAEKPNFCILYCWPTDDNRNVGKSDVVHGSFDENGELRLASECYSFSQVWELKKWGENKDKIGMKSHYWLNLDEDSDIQIKITEFPTEIEIAESDVKRGLYKIKLGERYLSFKNGMFLTGTKEESVSVFLYKQVAREERRILESLTCTHLPVAQVNESLTGTTKGQPFLPGITAKSKNFRIPAMVTLGSGRIVASADARWDQGMDADGIDIVVSYSDDNGENWHYTTPLHFGDSPDGGDHEYMKYSATIMDSALIRAENDHLFLLADLYPGGIALNTAPMRPDHASGYVEMDGVQRLVLYYGNRPELQNGENWVYYVGDFEEKDGGKFAPVYEKNGKIPKYYLDDGYYLYDENYEVLYCSRLEKTKTYKVRQNVFFYNADLHVRCATYLGLIKSVDGGVTWSKPVILNPQFLPSKMEMNFYGVGPGSGISLKDGTLMFPVYKYNGGNKQRSSFIYSTDGGNRWERSEDAAKMDENWCSESVLVEIDEKTVRQFVRHGYSEGNRGYLRYVDFRKEGGKWVAGEQVDVESVVLDVDCQLSAIRLEKTLDGKSVILVSAPTAYRRRNGKIFAFTLGEGNKLEKISEYFVETSDKEENKYAYSCLTEQKNGRIGLLTEDGRMREEIRYMTFSLEELLGKK